MGAAATALGALLACVLPRGAITGAPAAAAQHAVDALLDAARNTPRLARSGAAKCGIAAGLAALLGVRHGVVWLAFFIACVRAHVHRCGGGCGSAP